ncbi:hypothetical protein TSAR_015444 [Trichomalopsis sarcophagae]|uniref:Ionotropic glutamate receptor C-terminal domain-containing protein n=1 Tax=Trichomalopsis sarcophagae TaxID=543379 RepID=A0A232FE81_9HYME|nr:hypothetical protein TSAR_015444 [Trichomalopsis sarcophagae]
MEDNVLDGPYYVYCKNYLSAFGTWPLQSYKIKLLLRTLMYLGCSSAFIPHVTKAYELRNHLEYFFVCIPSIIFYVQVLTKISCMILNEDKYKELIQQIKSDFQSYTGNNLRILNEYAEQARKYRLRYVFAGYFMGTIVAYNTSAFVPLLLDLLVPLNETRPRPVLRLMKYNIKRLENNFFVVSLHGFVLNILGMMLIMGFDTLLLNCSQHACALFQIVIIAKWSDSVIKKIVEINPYMIFFNIDHVSSFLFEDMKTLLQIIPAIMLNSNQLSFKERRAYLSGIVPFTISDKKLHIVLSKIQVENGNEEQEDLPNRFLKYYSKSSYKRTRARCLLIVSADKPLPESYTNSILYKSWNNQFLDFTMLNVIKNSKTSDVELVKLFYNPFQKLFINEPWNHSSQLFPDKLKDMNGYPLKVPVFQLPPYLNLNKNSDGSIRNVNGMHYGFFSTLSNFRNFSIKIIAECKASNNTTLRAVLHNLLHKNEVNLLPVPQYTVIFGNQSITETSFPVDFISFIALVPVQPYNLFILPHSLFFNLLAVLTMYAIIIITIRLLKFDIKYWSPIFIIEMLLSVPVLKTPRNLAERIVFISIVFVSFTYTNDGFLKLMDIKIVSDSRNFDTYKELSDSGLDIYIEAPGYDTLLPSYDKQAKRIISKMKKLSQMNECVNKLILNKNCICLVSEPYGELLLQSYGAYDAKPILKKSNLKIFFSYVSFHYEKASPYVRRFDEILIRIVESGIPKMWAPIYQRDTNQTVVEETNNISTIQFYSVLAVVYGMSFVVFCLEFVYDTIDKHKIEATSDTAKDSNSRDVFYQEVVKVIIKHKHAIEFVDLVESTYAMANLLVIGITLGSITLAEFETVQHKDDHEIAFRYAIFTSGELLHILFHNYPGQRIKDHSLMVYQSYNCEWYREGITDECKKLLSFMMLRSQKPSCLTGGGLYVLGLENYATILKASLSYFTFLSSV